MADREPAGKGKQISASAATELAGDDADVGATAVNGGPTLENGRTAAPGPDGQGAQPASPPWRLAPGARFDRFRIVEKLGEGGMGTVLAAYDPDLDRKIAIKILLPRARDDEAVKLAGQRLLREAQAMARLTHANVVAVHSVGTVGDQVYVAMELVDGETLDTWCRAERRSWREVIDKFLGAGRGLAAAHAVGLVHRDFKPSNVLLGRDGRVLVTDFGLVGTAAAEVGPAGDPTPDGDRPASSTPLSTSLTHTGALLGTPVYMAPEQHERKRADARADQYAFCVALYEALYGRRPFNAIDYAQLALRVCTSPAAPPPPGTDVPARIRNAVMRGLEREPARRFPSMDALLAELERDPVVERRRLRNRVILSAALVVLVALASVGILRRGDAADQRCKAAADRLAGVWDDTARAAIEQAFAATGRSYAKGVYTRVAARLDAFANAWVAAHTDACKATHERHEQSDAVLDARMRCLDHRLGEARALIAFFAERPDEEVLERAIQATARLGGIETCADVARVSARALPPADSALRARVEAIRERLDRAMALERTGKYREALAIAVDATREAAATGYAPLVALARYRLGGLREEVGDSAAAESELQAALEAAAAAKDDELAAETWTELLWVVGHAQARVDEAMQMEASARAAVARAGGGAHLRVKLALHLGDLLRTRGDYRQAQDKYRAALTILEQNPGADDNEMMDALNRLGAIASVQDEFDTAWDYYQRVLAMGERLLGSDHPSVAGHAGNLGVVLVNAGKPDEARPYYDRALAIRERSLGPDHPDVALTLFNLSSLTFQQGKLDEALGFAERALSIRERALGPGHPEVAESLQSVGNVYWYKGELAKAQELYERGLAIMIEALGPEHPSIAHASGNLGSILAAQGKFDEAWTHLERSLAAKEKALRPGHPSIGYSLYNLGELREKQRRPGDACAYFERALEIWEKAFGERNPDVADARFSLARNLWDARRERRRAVALVKSALSVYAEAGDSKKGEAAAARAWLRAHAP